MAQVDDSKPQAIKAKQVNIRLTAEQDRLLKQYCVQKNLTTQAAMIKALQGLIDGF